jgi:hypothetical protein
MKTKLLIAMASALAVAIAFVAFPLALPKDAALQSTFLAYRTTFEEIRTRMIAERVWFADSCRSVRVNGVTTQANAYHDLVQRIGCASVAIVDEEGAARYVYAVEGSGSLGLNCMKGIEYVPESHEQRLGSSILESLDTAISLPPRLYYRRLAPQWYIVLQHNED